MGTAPIEYSFLYGVPQTENTDIDKNQHTYETLPTQV